VSTEVIVLNGVSSSGKTSIARCLQSMLTTPWLLLGIDDLIRPRSPTGGSRTDHCFTSVRPDRSRLVLGSGFLKSPGTRALLPLPPVVPVSSLTRCF